MAAASFSRSPRDAHTQGIAEGGRVAEEDLGEGFGDDGLEAQAWRPRGVFARRAAAEIDAGQQDRSIVNENR